MRAKLVGVLVCSCFLMMAGCAGKATVNTVEEYLKWLNDKSNGLVQSKKVNGLIISVKYLPAAYLTWKEMEDNNVKKRDSLLNIYSNTRTFLLTIAPDEEKGNKEDIMLSGLKNYQEYVERSMAMNFDMSNYITLKTAAGEYKPVLSNLENTYSLGSSRTIVVVFAPKEKDEFNGINNWDFVYTDELFDVGIMHFNFSQKDIATIPEINFWKK